MEKPQSCMYVPTKPSKTKVNMENQRYYTSNALCDSEKRQTIQQFLVNRLVDKTCTMENVTTPFLFKRDPCQKCNR